MSVNGYIMARVIYLKDSDPLLLYIQYQDYNHSLYVTYDIKKSNTGRITSEQLSFILRNHNNAPNRDIYYFIYQHYSKTSGIHTILIVYRVLLN